MFIASLPPLPPPPTSLLPNLSPEHHQHHHHHHIAAGPQTRRPTTSAAGPAGLKPNNASTSRHSLAALALDERTIAQRKMAIAMYGFSWLKPAGCAKTMLGRREEEVEREEMERQLREAELEEQMAFEGEEGERAEELRRQAEAEGNVVGTAPAPGGAGAIQERDLDDLVPDADVEADEDDEEQADDEDELMDGDLDDEIPDADAEDFRYDTRREPDSDVDGEGETGITDDVEASHLHSSTNETRRGGQAHRPLPSTGNSRARPSSNTAQVNAPGTTTPWTEVDDEEALANAMLDEDELGEAAQDRDLDDDIPPADPVERDLDDDVPQASEDDEGEWQHTDTELEMEESEMDLSGFGPAPPPLPAGGMQTRSQTRRRTSGNSNPMAPSRTRTQQLQTPSNPTVVGAGTTSVNASSGGIRSTSTSSARMSWLDPAQASARRNLFAPHRVGSGSNAGLFAAGSGISSGNTRHLTPPQLQLTSGPAQSVRSRRRLGAAGGARRGTENGEGEFRLSLD